MGSGWRGPADRRGGHSPVLEGADLLHNEVWRGLMMGVWRGHSLVHEGADLLQHELPGATHLHVVGPHVRMLPSMWIHSRLVSSQGEPNW